MIKTWAALLFTPKLTSLYHTPWISTLISHRLFLESFCRSQFPHKSVNLSFTITNIKNNMTDLRGNWVLQNDLKNTLCEINSGRDLDCLVVVDAPDLEDEKGPQGWAVRGTRDPHCYPVHPVTFIYSVVITHVQRRIHTYHTHITYVYSVLGTYIQRRIHT